MEKRQEKGYKRPGFFDKISKMFRKDVKKDDKIDIPPVLSGIPVMPRAPEGNEPNEEPEIVMNGEIDFYKEVNEDNRFPFDYAEAYMTGMESEDVFEQCFTEAGVKLEAIYSYDSAEYHGIMLRIAFKSSLDKDNVVWAFYNASDELSKSDAEICNMISSRAEEGKAKPIKEYGYLDKAKYDNRLYNLVLLNVTAYPKFSTVNVAEIVEVLKKENIL